MKCIASLPPVGDFDFVFCPFRMGVCPLSSCPLGLPLPTALAAEEYAQKDPERCRPGGEGQGLAGIFLDVFRHVTPRLFPFFPQLMSRPAQALARLFNPLLHPNQCACRAVTCHVVHLRATTVAPLTGSCKGFFA